MYHAVTWDKIPWTSTFLTISHIRRAGIQKEPVRHSWSDLLWGIGWRDKPWQALLVKHTKPGKIGAGNTSTSYQLTSPMVPKPGYQCTNCDTDSAGGCSRWNDWILLLHLHGQVNTFASEAGMPLKNRGDGRLMLPGAGNSALLHAVITTLLHASLNNHEIAGTQF